jgi:flagellar hook assembly protein FlgD
MTTTSGVSGSSSGGLGTDTSQAFRNADFLKIMLAEVTNQNPLEPQETGKLVDNMQKLQDLANTTYAKFRADIKWAQDLMGQTVGIQQQPLDPAQKEALEDKGLRPDVGFAQKTGKVTGFRVVDQVVYLQVGEHDYPTDNLKQIIPENNNAAYLATMADQMLGKKVVYQKPDGSTANGTITSVAYDAGQNLVFEIGDQRVPYTAIKQIGVAGA